MTAKSAITLPHPSTLDGLSLVETDRLVADLTARAQAYVSEVNRARRSAIHRAVDGPGVTGSRRKRVEAVAAQLGISQTQVYQAIRADAAEPGPPNTPHETLARASS